MGGEGGNPIVEILRYHFFSLYPSSEGNNLKKNIGLLNRTKYFGGL